MLGRGEENSPKDKSGVGWGGPVSTFFSGAGVDEKRKPSLAVVGAGCWEEGMGAG